nr:ABC-three component system protein [Megamonas funiformis]
MICLQDNRRLFSDNEKQVLFDEVYGRCPICGKRLTHKKNGRIYRTFEVAHIYPANPKPDEIILLSNEERLSEDVNDLKNVIAVCRICHKKFDTPRTIDEYRKWVRMKKQILQENEIKDNYISFNIEEDIITIIDRLNSVDIEEFGTSLSLNSLKIDEKANDTLPYILKHTIKHNVVDYFNFIKKIFLDIDKNTPYKFNTIAAQIKSFYYKCMQINNNQEAVYYALVNWIDEKTNHYSKMACEILVAFFIQDCEVFS